MDEKNELLEELDCQLDDIKDLADIPLGSESPDASAQTSTDVSAAQNPSSAEEASGQIPSAEGSSAQASSFKQDSSEVVSDSEPFDIYDDS